MIVMHTDDIRSAIEGLTTADFEIMAPVGSRESLAAALNAGAD